tara:strand:- start:16 stop:285 length:270 start_codon:yes stop_codon:yes gene_type:complete
MGRRDSRRDVDITFGAREQSDGSYLHNDGAISWYNEVGQRHREEGPACIYNDGSVNWWYIDGRIYSFNDWCNKLNKTDEDKMLLKLQYG